jgi:glycogen debranching enzyme
VQAYVYAARRAAATVATALGLAGRATELTDQAEILQRRFENAFWCEDLSTYAIALDGAGRPCRVRTSNAGHCLFAGIASPERARRVARTLFSAESFSGWGVRTVAASETGYNPMGYHTGSIWPHDNALIASGLARYGFGEKAL